MNSTTRLRVERSWDTWLSREKTSATAGLGREGDSSGSVRLYIGEREMGLEPSNQAEARLENPWSHMKSQSIWPRLIFPLRLAASAIHNQIGLSADHPLRPPVHTRPGRSGLAASLPQGERINTRTHGPAVAHGTTASLTPTDAVDHPTWVAGVSNCGKFAFIPPLGGSPHPRLLKSMRGE